MLMVLLCTLFVVSAVSALPIGSRDELRNYALSQVVKGQIHVHSESMDYSFEGMVNHAEVDGIHAEDVLTKLGEIEFRFRIINPSDKVRVHVYLQNTTGHTLFYGYEEFSVKEFAKGKMLCNLWMQNIPILSGVRDAEVIALLPDGSSGRRYSLEVVDGKVMFQSWLAGIENGILVVRYHDGTLGTFSLSPFGTDSSPGSTTNAEGTQFRIPGHYVFHDPDLIEIVELWERPTIFLDLSKDKSVILSVIGIVVKSNGALSQERPLTAEVTDVETGGVYTMPLGSTTTLPLPKGQYRFRFEWKEFGKPGFIYAGPDEGGKG